MKWIIWPFLVLLPLWTWSQDQGAHLKIAYLGGQITHPGMTVGLSKAFHTGTKTRNNGNQIRREWRYGLNFGAYYHRDLHTGILVTPQLEWLRTGSRGGQWGMGLAAGYLRTFIPNTYAVDEEGTVKKKPLAGTDHAVLIPSLRIGRDLYLKKQLHLEWYIQANLQIQYPYFEGFNTYFLLEAGITYPIGKHNNK